MTDELVIQAARKTRPKIITAFSLGQKVISVLLSREETKNKILPFFSSVSFVQLRGDIETLVFIGRYSKANKVSFVFLS